MSDKPTKAEVNLPLQRACNELRAEILEIGNEVLDLKKMVESGADYVPETMSNIMLSYRHLEDARMRLGKVMQALQGGASIFDKPKEEQEKIVDELNAGKDIDEGEEKAPIDAEEGQN